MPAIALEDRITDRVIEQLSAPHIIASLSKQNTASIALSLRKTIEAAIGALSLQPRECVLELVAQVRLTADQIKITLDRSMVE